MPYNKDIVQDLWCDTHRYLLLCSHYQQSIGIFGVERVPWMLSAKASYYSSK